MFDRVLNMPLVSIRSNDASFGLNIKVLNMAKNGRKVKLQTRQEDKNFIGIEICCLISREKCSRNCKTCVYFL